MLEGSAERARNALIAAVILGNTLLAACGAQVNAVGITPPADEGSAPPATAPADKKSAVAEAFDQTGTNVVVPSYTTEIADGTNTEPVEVVQDGEDVVVPEPTKGEPTPTSSSVVADTVDEPLYGVGGEPETAEGSQADAVEVVDEQAVVDVGQNDTEGASEEGADVDGVDENIYMVELKNGINVQIDMADIGIKVADTVRLEAILEYIVEGENNIVNINVSTHPGTEKGLYGNDAKTYLASIANDLGMAGFKSEYVDLALQSAVFQKLIGHDGRVYYNVIVWDKGNFEQRCDALAYVLWGMALNNMYPGHPYTPGKDYYMFSEAFQNPTPITKFFTDEDMVSTGQQIYDVGSTGQPDYREQVIFEILGG